MSKMLILVLLSVNLFSLVLADGPYNVDLIYESDGLRNGPYYSGATLYYPIDAPEPFAIKNARHLYQAYFYSTSSIVFR